MAGFARVLGWLPTPTIGLYVVRNFLALFAMVLLILVGVLQTLDLVTRADEILAPDGNDRGALIRYALLRIPQLADQFIPFAVLLASLFTLTTFRQRSEITMMRAAGLSAPVVLLPMISAGAAIAIAHAVFTEAVVVPGTAALNYWEANDFVDGRPPPGQVRNDVWIRTDRADDSQVIVKARHAHWRDTSFELTDVTAYRLDEASRILSTDRAQRAVFDGNGWTLIGARQLDVDSGTVIDAAESPWPINLRPQEIFALATEAEETGWIELRQRASELRRAGLSGDALQTAALHRISGPLASMFMPLLAAIAGFGVSRAGGLFIRVVSGMALGFAYFIIDNLTRAMGDFGILPPAIAAFSPLLIFAVVGAAAMLEIER